MVIKNIQLNRDIPCILTDIGNLTLYHLMLNSEAMCACQVFNEHWLKRKHRKNTYIYTYHLNSLKNMSIDDYSRPIDIKVDSFKYKPIDLKEHLTKWCMELNKGIVRIGVLNTEFMQISGFDDLEPAKKIKKQLLRDYEKVTRWIDKFESSGWDNTLITCVGMHVHDKVKKCEQELEEVIMSWD